MTIDFDFRFRVPPIASQMAFAPPSLSSPNEQGAPDL